MRGLPLLLVAATLSLPVVAAPPSYAVPTCGGKRVTIDLNRPGAPDPRRPASDVVLGTDGFDKISTGRGHDIVCGGLAPDWIKLGPGDDKAYGQAGNDQLTGGPGRDRLEGGRHADRAIYRGAPRGVHVDLRVAGPQATGWGRDNLIEMEGLSGSVFDDVLQTTGFATEAYGGPGDDLLRGADGEDQLVGGPGDDDLLGGAGHDHFEGTGWTALGTDVADGGAGHDVFFGATEGDSYDGGDDHDLFYSSHCSPCGSAPVELRGGAGDDAFNLSAVDELVVGGDGRDSVDYFFAGLHADDGETLVVDLAVVGPQDTVSAGTDDLSGVEDVHGAFGLVNQLFGDDGPNRLFGKDLDDVLVGRGGDDTLSGGEGTDACDGGTGTNELIDCEP